MRPVSWMRSAVLVALVAATGCGLSEVYVAPTAPVVLDTGVVSDEIDATLFLVGDAGLAESADDPVLATLTADAGRTHGPTLIVFLGDNVYWDGIPADEGRDAAELRLLAQIDAARSAGAEAVFVAGNHDHHANAPERVDGLERQAALTEGFGGGRAEFLPLPGAPGPVVRELGTRVRLAYLDTQSLLAADGPDDATLQDVAAELGILRDGADGRYLVVAGHHPLATHGRHGGYFPLMDHLFIPLRSPPIQWVPLPVLSSLHVLLRSLGISPQDSSNSRNVQFVRALEVAFRQARPLVYAAGHEHALQVLAGPAGGDRYRVVSGAGSIDRPDVVTYEDDTLYAAQEAGYARIDFLRDGRVLLEMVAVENAEAAPSRVRLWLVPRPDALE